VAIRPKGAIQRQLRTVFNLGAIGELTDGQLLERFAIRGGEAAELAFAALVERHGPTVMRVCRHTLGNPNDADDAFQATFLILVKNGQSLWIRDSLKKGGHSTFYYGWSRSNADQGCGPT
jgi:HlyD family secretion protein